MTFTNFFLHSFQSRKSNSLGRLEPVSLLTSSSWFGCDKFLNENSMRRCPSTALTTLIFFFFFFYLSKLNKKLFLQEGDRSILFFKFFLLNLSKWKCCTCVEFFGLQGVLPVWHILMFPFVKATTWPWNPSLKWG